MKLLVTVLIIFALSFLIACPFNPFPGYDYPRGVFSEEVTNFESLNSVYDDYNSASPYIDDRRLFFFSTNRSSRGLDFDIADQNLWISWSMDDGTLEISPDYNNDYPFLSDMIENANSPANELGPYIIAQYASYGNYDIEYKGLLMYANDSAGNYDIKFSYEDSTREEGTTLSRYKGTYNAEFLNTEADELYPTFFGESYSNPKYYYYEGGESAIVSILFCSNRQGNFDLYQASLSVDDTAIEKLINTTNPTISKLPISSSANDKCPFTNGTLLVFASDRPGGFGGFDLYYSNFVNGAWTEPQNFGENINTSSDEYRPIVLSIPNFTNNLMIFSSNRAGGRGGFDLYHIGISQEVRPDQFQ